MAVKMATGRTEAPMMMLWKNTPISLSSYKYIKIAIIMTYMAWW